MAPPRGRPFTLLDAMILVAATAVWLGIVRMRFYDEGGFLHFAA